MPTEPSASKPVTASKLVHRAFASVPEAEAAFDRLLALGVDAASVSVIARGVAVDQRLVGDEEMNANSAAGSPVPQHRSALARKLSHGKRYLVEGCWITGPIAGRPDDEKLRPGPGDVQLLLAEAGLPAEEATGIEARLQGPGGVWLGVDPGRSGVPGVARALGLS